MKYKELEKQIQNLNNAYDEQLEVFNNGQSLYIGDTNRCYAIISNQMSYSLYVSGIALEYLEDNLRHDLLKAVYEFAQTPVDSRDLFPRFYISSRLTPVDSERFLFKCDGDIDCLAWGEKDGGGTEFTQKEIDYICDKFNTNLNDFNIDEVEE